MLCATIQRENIESIKRANKEADLIEFRLDLFQPKNLKYLREICHKPVIFTLKEFNDEFLRLAPDYVDLPFSSAPSVFEKIKTAYPHIQRICSYHDFEQTGKLEEILSQMKRCPAEVYKIATMARSSLDSLRMLHLVKKHKIVGLCMGEDGEITRILAPVFGAPWTYTPIESEQRTAPGQLLLRDLTRTYHFPSLSPKTALYGLIGDPVSKSQSHVTHNFAFRKFGLDAVYVKMRVTKEKLDSFIPLCRELGFRGLSITMPLKEAILPFLDEFSEDQSAINTIAFQEGKIQGWNTDGPGALDALEKKIKVRGKTVVLLGAGGAAKGIAVEAKKRGANLVIANRNFTRAQKIAKEVDAESFSLSDFPAIAHRGYDILINCTSVGMGEDSHLPVAKEDLLEKRVVMDIITQTQQTPLLLAAKEKGCQTIEGMEMFIQQAVGQYCHWFNKCLN